MIENFQILLQNILRTAAAVGIVLALMWLVFLVDTYLLHERLKRRFGLIPRGPFSPGSILISPFLHVNFAHLAANSIPFFVLGSLVRVQGQLSYWLTTGVIIVVAGLGIWLFGKSGTQHMGASGLILGYFGFTLASVFFAPDLVTIIIAIIVAVLYLGLIWQVAPMKKGVSTTGHLFGFLGGILVAGVMALLRSGM